MRTENLAILLLLGSLNAVAEDAPVAAGGVEDVAECWAERDWRLDTAIFTEIAAFNAPEVAIKLPPDQASEDSAR